MNQTAIKLGQLIKGYRTEAGMTQLDLSTKLGYDTPQFVSLFERGVSKVPIETMGKLIVILGIPEKKFTEIIFSEYKARVSVALLVGKETAKGKV